MVLGRYLPFGYLDLKGSIYRCVQGLPLHDGGSAKTQAQHETCPNYSRILADSPEHANGCFHKIGGPLQRGFGLL